MKNGNLKEKLSDKKANLLGWGWWGWGGGNMGWWDGGPMREGHSTCSHMEAHGPLSK